MKFPELNPNSGLTTMGLFGTVLFTLSQTGFMNPLWGLVGLFFVFAAIGNENGKNKS